MIIELIFAASCSFTATATGVDAGTPIEFAFAGKGTDRDYETLFEIDESVKDFCRRLESCGLPRGKPMDAGKCDIWATGCPLRIDPPLSDYIDSKFPSDLPLAGAIYSGGTRDAADTPVADTNMPLAVFSLYSLGQSPIVLDGQYPQGLVYNCHKAKKKLVKGDRVKFTLTWDAKEFPIHRDLQLSFPTAKSQIEELRTLSATSTVEACVGFSPEMSVHDAKALASALSIIDGPRIKINGVYPGQIHFRALLPEPDWTDRQKRVVQPFELTIGKTNQLCRINSDWSGPDLDPKLTIETISIEQAEKLSSIQTCFIFCSPDCPLSRIYDAIASLRKTKISTWYIFAQQCGKFT